MQQQYMGMNSRSLLISALIAGVGIGLLSNIPLIACVNCLLFAWVWGGGIGAVYLYRQNEHTTLVTTSQGLVIGALAGAIGAVVGGLVSLLFGGLGAAFQAAVQQIAGQSGTNLPGFLFSSGANIIGIFVNIILYAIFGAIGGLIATALIWKTPTPLAPPPPYTPPPSGPVM